ncbi:MAG: hypothetical protein KIT72_09455 [Polyangiaceae bacterium]|nr:hypothetical protein [Polyangiaceae bacterium]MCW5790633.1 hypothetical protein [Polyangiaceae bacterium]
MGEPAGAFHARFERWARRVRRRLALSYVLSGFTYGLVLGAAAAGLAWWLRAGALRPWAVGLGVLGAGAALAWAVRRRFSDQEVALYLDARTGGEEVVSTAVELLREAERNDPARQLVVTQAAEHLKQVEPARVRPRVLARRHALGPLALAGIVYLSLIALPRVPEAAPPPPGAELVQVDELKGLERIIQLTELDARDAEQRKRLDAIAKEAEKLREDLKQGLEKREALARIARLRDQIQAEKLSHGDAKNRAGLEAALSKLRENKLEAAAKALGDGDLTEFDREMQRLANQAEESARDAAKEALEQAAKAAKERGAKDLAESLEEQQKRFEERSEGAQALRELGRQLGERLGEQGQKDLREFGEQGSPEARQRLAEALGEALEGMTEEERRQLAENLGKQLEQGGGGAMSPEQLKDLAEALKDPAKRQQLQDALKELGQPQGSDDSRREQGLDDADRGGGEAQKGLGVPTPAPGQGDQPGQQGQQGPKGQKPGQSPSQGQSPGQQGGPGSDRDEGEGDHGATGKERISGDELRSKANAKWNKEGGLHGATLGRSSSSGGRETANQRGAGGLGRVAPQEIGGVERSEVPEEYREQVGRYFQP